MSLIEIVAAIFGFLSVWFYIVRNPASWPTGLVQVLLLWWVFWNAKLYADLGLHIIYAGLQLYGWWAWLRVPSVGELASAESPRMTEGASFRKAPTALLSAESIPIRSLGVVGLAVCVGTVLVLTGISSALLIHFTDASLPVLDSFIAGTSIVAQCLLAARFVENWRFWILVDVVGIGVFAAKGLYPTTILYVLFLAMAIYGDRVWRASVHPSTQAAREST